MGDSASSAAAVSDAAGLAKSRVSRQTAITQSAPSAAEGRRSANSDGPSSVVVRFASMEYARWLLNMATVVTLCHNEPSTKWAYVYSSSYVRPPAPRVERTNESRQKHT